MTGNTALMQRFAIRKAAQNQADRLNAASRERVVENQHFPIASR
jgi:hypothetical protein